MPKRYIYSYAPNPRSYKRPKLGYRTGVAANLKRRNSASSTSTATKTSSYAGSGVTAQRDSIMQYRKRRMPRGKARRWRSFVKKVHAVANTDLGLRTVLFNQGVFCTPAANGQSFCNVTLYGNAGDNPFSETGNDDLYQIQTNDADFTKTSRAQFRSAVCDITMTNSLIAEPAEAVNYTAEVDVYRVYYRARDDEIPSITAANAAALSEVNPISVGGTTLNLFTRGATPFTLGQLIRQSGMVIVSKKKYLIPYGDSATYQYRDPKNHFISGQAVGDAVSTEMCLKGTTTGFLIIVKYASPTAIKPFDVRTTRTYTYKIQDKNVSEIKNEEL